MIGISYNPITINVKTRKWEITEKTEKKAKVKGKWETDVVNKLRWNLKWIW